MTTEQPVEPEGEIWIFLDGELGTGARRMGTTSRRPSRWRSCYVPQRWPAERLLGVMTHCSDIMRGDLCDELDVEGLRTYAAAAQQLLRERRDAKRALVLRASCSE